MTASYRLLITGILVFMLLTGCKQMNQFFGAEKTGQIKGEIGQTPSEKEKAKLLKQIDKKYSDPDAHYRLGKLYQDDALWAQAEHHFSIALSFDPSHRKTQAARVKTLIETGDKAKSELLADEYISQASNSAACSLKLAIAFQKEMLDDYALACYQQSLNLAPNSAKINRQIGYYYLSKNDRETAKGYLVRSFQLDPLQPEVAGQLGKLGVAIQVPRKQQKDTKKLDKIVEESGKAGEE